MANLVVTSVVNRITPTVYMLCALYTIHFGFLDTTTISYQIRVVYTAQRCALLPKYTL